MNQVKTKDGGKIMFFHMTNNLHPCFLKRPCKLIRRQLSRKGRAKNINKQFTEEKL